MPSFPSAVKIVEVGPRDGLQNESQVIPLDIKIELIERLVAAGLRTIEAGAFVSPKWVPQMADTAEVMAGLHHREGVAFPVLVPNMKGLEAALESGVDEIAVFGAASESFSCKNINCSIEESLARFGEVCKAARGEGLRVRGYVSCVLGCPYEGDVAAAVVAEVSERLMEIGCYEISLGDTIGVGTPGKARTMIETVSARVPVESLAVHFHDTYGQALANILTSLELGIATIDSAVAGLGGCPYASGASGNVSSEDVVYMLDGLGIESGVNLQSLVMAGNFVSTHLGRAPSSKTSIALAGQLGLIHS